MMECRICPRNCGASRGLSFGDGWCRMGWEPRIARAALHAWEEPCISGSRGSGTVFFTGCPLRCVYCQNTEISQQDFAGEPASPCRLREIFEHLIEQGAHNINLVNPTHFALAVWECLREWKPPVPVIYNSSGYEKLETLRRLEGYIDVYLPDFKYWESSAAKAYSQAPGYAETAREAIQEMARQTGKVQLDPAGMVQKGTIVRHLVLPGHTRQAMQILQWIADTLSDTVWVSLMAQYLPWGRVLEGEAPELNRKITRREWEKVQDFLFSLGLDGFVQERSAATPDFIPSFSGQSEK